MEGTTLPAVSRKAYNSALPSSDKAPFVYLHGLLQKNFLKSLQGTFPLRSTQYTLLNTYVWQDRKTTVFFTNRAACSFRRRPGHLLEITSESASALIIIKFIVYRSHVRKGLKCCWFPYSPTMSSLFVHSNGQDCMFTSTISCVCGIRFCGISWGNSQATVASVAKFTIGIS